VIDALHGGNASRWINHSCAPNCVADEDGGRIFIKALRNIKAGEELNYDYGLMIDERYTPELKADYPAAAAPQLPRHPAVQRPRNGRGRATQGEGQGPIQNAQEGMSEPLALIWPVADLRATLAAALPGATVEVCARIDSTNTELMRRARAGAASRCCWWPSSRRRARPPGPPWQGGAPGRR
jgi:hypothetical protein